jgi:hypothetical protein
MSEGNGQALAIREEVRPAQLVYEPNSIAEALQLAKVLVDSKLLPRAIGTPQQAFTVMAAGKELGLTAMQALRSIHVIDGKPSCSADLILALVKKRRDVCRYFRLVTSTDKVATYETLREGDPEATSLSFTIEDAQRAQLTGKTNWKQYPAAMLRARCIAALARAVYPDLVLGVYETDELDRSAPAKQPLRGVVTDAGVTVEAEVTTDAVLTEKLQETVAAAGRAVAEDAAAAATEAPAAEAGNPLPPGPSKFEQLLALLDEVRQSGGWKSKLDRAKWRGKHAADIAALDQSEKATIEGAIDVCGVRG